MDSDEDRYAGGGGRSPTPPRRGGRSRSRDRRGGDARGRGGRDDKGGRQGKRSRSRSLLGLGRGRREEARSRSPSRKKQVFRRCQSPEHDDRGSGGPPPRTFRRVSSPQRDEGREGGGKGGCGSAFGKGGKGKREKTTGTKVPKLWSIHKGTVVSCQQYGAFCRLGDGSEFKDGLIHISRICASGRIDKVEDVLSEGEKVFVKVSEVKDEDGKFSLDMRFVGQKDGEDKDPHNIQAEASGGGRGGKGGKPEPIKIGAIQDVTCTRCGAHGHLAKECWAGKGKRYDLVAEGGDDVGGGNLGALDSGGDAGCERPSAVVQGHDPSVVKAALKAFLQRKNPGASSSSSSGSKKKKKKAKKKEKKKLKKLKKKEKKAQKKLQKEVKKREKKEAKKEPKKEKDAKKEPREAASAVKEEPPAKSEAAEDKKATKEKKPIMAAKGGAESSGSDSSSSSS
eukprot:TRINITY_DN26537_c0_g1_i1.p1 TRINITY_DN26537_c0_g1~~TRINITY_DN26537_c0_g1_i1.p1  ORF type:complete len:452 (+),score=151.08 TRINITY_DN26537_c0_g1_i1:201-1556(+)